jgi:hypothetical protein
MVSVLPNPEPSAQVVIASPFDSPVRALASYQALSPPREDGLKAGGAEAFMIAEPPESILRLPPLFIEIDIFLLQFFCLIIKQY